MCMHLYWYTYDRVAYICTYVHTYLYAFILMDAWMVGMYTKAFMYMYAFILIGMHIYALIVHICTNLYSFIHMGDNPTLCLSTYPSGFLRFGVCLKVEYSSLYNYVYVYIFFLYIYVFVNSTVQIALIVSCSSVYHNYYVLNCAYKYAYVYIHNICVKIYKWFLISA
jgi:hypothetical protein